MSGAPDLNPVLGLTRTCCALLALGIAAAASAQSYPSRPLRVVVPYAAGGSTDVLARMIGQKLTASLGQSVIIDNRTGAGTLIATEIVAHAAADGYTLIMATPPLTVAPALYAKLPFDVERDFAPITNIAATSNVLVVHPAVPAQNVKELVALAKAQPGVYTFGSSGVGGASRLEPLGLRLPAAVPRGQERDVARESAAGERHAERGGRRERRRDSRHDLALDAGFGERVDLLLPATEEHGIATLPAHARRRHVGICRRLSAGSFR